MVENGNKPKVQVSLFVPRALKQRLPTFCIERGSNQTNVIAEALEGYLDCPPEGMGRGRDGAMGQSMLDFGLLMLQLDAEERTVALSHINRDSVKEVCDFVASLEVSENSTANELARRIRETVFHGDDDLSGKEEASAERSSKESGRRKSSDDDKAINVRLSADLHRRYKRESIERGESVNLMVVCAMLEYAEREGFRRSREFKRDRPR